MDVVNRWCLAVRDPQGASGDVWSLRGTIMYFRVYYPGTTRVSMSREKCLSIKFNVLGSINGRSFLYKKVVLYSTRIVVCLLAHQLFFTSHTSGAHSTLLNTSSTLNNAQLFITEAFHGEQFSSRRALTEKTRIQSRQSKRIA